MFLGVFETFGLVLGVFGADEAEAGSEPKFLALSREREKAAVRWEVLWHVGVVHLLKKRRVSFLASGNGWDGRIDSSVFGWIGQMINKEKKNSLQEQNRKKERKKAIVVFVGFFPRGTIWLWMGGWLISGNWPLKKAPTRLKTHLVGAPQA